MGQREKQSFSSRRRRRTARPRCPTDIHYAAHKRQRLKSLLDLRFLVFQILLGLEAMVQLLPIRDRLNRLGKGGDVDFLLLEDDSFDFRSANTLFILFLAYFSFLSAMVLLNLLFRNQL